MTGYNSQVSVSGERFEVTYRLQASADEVERMAHAICIEQTIEFPEDLVDPGDIRDHVFGRIEDLQASEQGFLARVSYAVETAGVELVQLLNVVFGNTSLVPGVRLEALHPSPALVAALPGPRFGVSGLRQLVGAPNRALLCTATKPMGLSNPQLAEMAYQLARGGLDIIKDDHGLADQPFTPFEDRVERCADAVARANAETGGRCLYAPNISGPGIHERAGRARELGATALLLAPGLVGLETARRLADDDAIALPLLGHPALSGSFVTRSTEGISHRALFGQIWRLAGLDTAIFPHAGGRFQTRPQDCQQAVEGCRESLGGPRPSLPMPAGGMTLQRVPEMLRFYGNDVGLLIGGDLHRGASLEGTCRGFRALVD